jgi:CheY-like chemotaxis protein
MPLPAGQHPPSPPERPLRVLVADDEPMIVKALERLLRRRGHLVDTAFDAYRALELVEANVYDAVMVDARMPGGGQSVLARLEETAFRGVRVLMTGEIAADATGVHDDVRRLQKPFPFPSVIPLLEDRASA